jgi:segregation and condensation protein A
LEFFEGPLDLLLHLIKKNEVSITDIPIATITEQYLATLELMETFSLDVAGEFLVMAATLIHIKSRMLLPAGDEERPTRFSRSLSLRIARRAQAGHRPAAERQLPRSHPR